MTERTDQLLIESLRKAPPTSFSDLQPWREYREDMYRALHLLDKRLEDADREEFETLQKRMQQLQARLGQASSPVMEFTAASTVVPVVPEPVKTASKRKAWKCGLCERTTQEEVCPNCKEMTAPPSYAETDAGSGVGGREPPMTTEEFREQLVGLRDRVTDRRARLGLG